MQIDSHFPDAVAAFFASGGRITACQDFTPQPRPSRSANIDPETKLARRKTKHSKPLAVEADEKKETRAPAVDVTASELETIRQYALAKMTQTDCARALRCDSKRVFRIAKHHGIVFTSRVRAGAKSDAEVAEIIRPLVAAGAPYGVMRTAAGCRRERLHRIINEFCREQVYARKNQPA